MDKISDDTTEHKPPGLVFVVTAGGTRERIDNIRAISNMGRGNMGAMIADKALKNSLVEKVVYIHTKGSVLPTYGDSENCELVEVEGVLDVQRAVEHVLLNQSVDVFVHSMAISDYLVDKVQVGEKTLARTGKISSENERMTIHLVRAPKIIQMIKKLQPNIYLVGFKLLDGSDEETLIDVARASMKKSNADLVLANDLAQIRSGEPHKGFLVFPDGKVDIAYGKFEIAQKLVATALEAKGD